MELIEICKVSRSGGPLGYGSILLNHTYSSCSLFSKYKGGGEYEITEVSFCFTEDYLIMNNIHKKNVRSVGWGTADYFKNKHQIIKSSNLVLLAGDLDIFCSLYFRELDILSGVATGVEDSDIVLRWD